VLPDLLWLKVLIDQINHRIYIIRLAAENVNIKVAVVLTEVSSDVRRLDHLAEADTSLVCCVSSEALDPWLAKRDHVDVVYESRDEFFDVLLR